MKTVHINMDYSSISLLVLCIVILLTQTAGSITNGVSPSVPYSSTKQNTPTTATSVHSSTESTQNGATTTTNVMVSTGTVSSSSESITNTSPDKTYNGIINSTSANSNNSMNPITTATLTTDNIDISSTRTPTYINTTITLQTHAVTNTTPPVISKDEKSFTASSTQTPTVNSTVNVYITIGVTNSSESSSPNPETTNPPVVICKKPETNFTNGFIEINMTTIVYGCHKDYVLEGPRVGFCRENGTWSVEAPRCVYNKSIERRDWMHVFVHFTEWYGYYRYHGNSYRFSFHVQRVSMVNNLVHAEFKENPAWVNMTGHKSNSTIVFITKQLLRPNERIRDSSFKLEGTFLYENTSAMRFQGKASSNEEIFMISMKPAVGKVQPSIDGGEKKALVIALSIILTSTLILALALLAYHLMKKRGLVGAHQGHNTLTSFENPVYEFENNMNNSLASES